MAVASAEQVQVVITDKGAMAVKRKVIVDPESGIVAVVENEIVAVDVGGGRIVTREQKRVQAIKLDPEEMKKALDSSPEGRPPAPRTMAINAPPPPRAPTPRHEPDPPTGHVFIVMGNDTAQDKPQARQPQRHPAPQSPAPPPPAAAAPAARRGPVYIVNVVSSKNNTLWSLGKKPLKLCSGLCCSTGLLIAGAVLIGLSLFSEAVFGCDALWLAVILVAVVTLVLASLFPPTAPAGCCCCILLTIGVAVIVPLSLRNVGDIKSANVVSCMSTTGQSVLGPAITFIISGSAAILVGCTCYAAIAKVKSKIIIWSAVLLSIVLLAAAIAGSVFVFRDNKDPETGSFALSSGNTTTLFSMAVLTYSALFLTCCFCCFAYYKRGNYT